MTIEELKHIIKKEKNNINLTMEGLIAKLEQMEALAPEKRKKVTKKNKTAEARARLHAKF